jgi:H+/Cl- antiporter ClcA
MGEFLIQYYQLSSYAVYCFAGIVLAIIGGIVLENSQKFEKWHALILGWDIVIVFLLILGMVIFFTKQEVLVAEYVARNFPPDKMLGALTAIKETL